MITTSSNETRAEGEAFAATLQQGDVVALIGELGAGKTCFVQGMARGLGVSEKAFVRSPSFTLLNQYEGRMPLYHFDFYRLRDNDDPFDLGLDEYFDGTGVTVIEWADRFLRALPARTIYIRFAIVDEETRKITIGK